MGSTITKVRKIGNSRGILFPKAILDEGGIVDTVKITVKNNVIIITPGDKKQKKAWSDFKRVKREKADFVANTFDAKEWEW
ncbi:MAG: AbrB/MazE/SpoVT family DNA-binding domain-containing protein [Flammeovirgaceae bacterium]|nr:MAG: AbrB/MazE/SpoVT family DNA-binding domain-containing protein [Flammeovirgaceae bacterium]